jgi:DNA-binding transcriptional MerR regulator
VTAALDHSTADVARILDLPEARLRYWAQTGLVGPSVRRGGRFFYTFVDLVAVRTVKELTAAGLSVQQIRKHLDALRAALPDAPLAALRVLSDGERLIVVADDGSPFEPLSGQLVLSFTVTAGAAEPPADPEPPPPPLSALGCFRAALERPRDAERLLRRAVTIDPRFAEAWSNLGAILDRRGDRSGALDAFERAVALDPFLSEARANLAELLDELGDRATAAAHRARCYVMTSSGSAPR